MNSSQSNIWYRTSKCATIETLFLGDDHVLRMKIDNPRQHFNLRVGSYAIYRIVHGPFGPMGTAMLSGSVWPGNKMIDQQHVIRHDIMEEMPIEDLHRTAVATARIELIEHLRNPDTHTSAQIDEFVQLYKRLSDKIDHNSVVIRHNLCDKHYVIQWTKVKDTLESRRMRKDPAERIIEYGSFGYKQIRFSLPVERNGTDYKVLWYTRTNERFPIHEKDDVRGEIAGSEIGEDCNIDEIRDHVVMAFLKATGKD